MLYHVTKLSRVIKPFDLSNGGGEAIGSSNLVPIVSDWGLENVVSQDISIGAVAKGVTIDFIQVAVGAVIAKVFLIVAISSINLCPAGL